MPPPRRCAPSTSTPPWPPPPRPTPSSPWQASASPRPRPRCRARVVLATRADPARLVEETDGNETTATHPAAATLTNWAATRSTTAA